MRGDQAGHRSAVCVDVFPAIRRVVRQQTHPRKDVAGQVRMVAVDPGVDDGHGDALSLAQLLNPRHIKEGQMPLRVSPRIGQGRSARDSHADKQPGGHCSR